MRSATTSPDSGPLPGLVIDLDASLVTCHSEKESAAATFKGGFGYHPLLAFLDNTGEALAGLLRPGNGQQHRGRSHAVTDLALAQIPDAERYGRPSGQVAYTGTASCVTARRRRHC